MNRVNKRNRSQRTKKQQPKVATRRQANRILALEQARARPARRAAPRRRATTTRSTHPFARATNRLSAAGQRNFIGHVMPFHPAARNAHTIDEHARPSWKLSGRARTVLTVGINGGRCFIFFNPIMASDKPSVFIMNMSAAAVNDSHSKFTGDAIAVAGLTYSVLNLQVPTTESNLNALSASYRYVAGGIKCRYSGPALQRGGNAIWYEDLSDGDSVLSTATANVAVNTVLATYPSQSLRYVNYNSAMEHEFTLAPPVQLFNSRWQTPTDDTSVQGRHMYEDNDQGGGHVDFGPQAARTATDVPTPTSVLVLQNNTASPLEYTLEFIVHCEFVDPQYAQLTTPSPPDPTSHSLIRAAVTSAKQQHADSPDAHIAHVASQSLLSSLEAGASQVGSAAINSIASYVSKPGNIEMLATGLAGLLM